MALTCDFPKICEWQFQEYKPGHSTLTQSSNLSLPWMRVSSLLYMRLLDGGSQILQKIQKFPTVLSSTSPHQPQELTTEPTSHPQWGSSFTSLPFPIYHTFPTISGRCNWGFRSWKISLWLPTYFGHLKSSTREEKVGGQVVFNTHVAINITWNVPSLNRNFQASLRHAWKKH